MKTCFRFTGYKEGDNKGVAHIAHRSYPITWGNGESGDEVARKFATEIGGEYMGYSYRGTEQIPYEVTVTQDENGKFYRSDEGEITPAQVAYYATMNNINSGVY